VTEKLDGSNVAVAKKGGEVLALVRAGYLAESSPHEQHHVFAEWVRRNDWAFLAEGFRVCGEWLYMAHGTIYRPTSPFVAFDVFDARGKRLPHDDQRALLGGAGIEAAAVIHDGESGMSVEAALSALGEHGFHGATETVEGAVWRIETAGQFNFLAKYVRPSKIDGKYFGQGPAGGDVVMCDPLALGVLPHP
jgi:ATP-dependent RNA circularization protein (DNA/RNA ligase family)